MPLQKVTRSAVLKRHGVQECILLVTQRVTKYPVLISRILQHSHGEGGALPVTQDGAGGAPTGCASCCPRAGPEEERQDLTTALGLVKELLSNVDQDVHELEKGARLQEIYHRMDPRAQAPVPGKGPFGREELLRRRLIHDGCLLWKTATGRFKGECVASGGPVVCGEGGASSLHHLSAQGGIWGDAVWGPAAKSKSRISARGPHGASLPGWAPACPESYRFDEDRESPRWGWGESGAPSRAPEWASGRQPGKPGQEAEPEESRRDGADRAEGTGVGPGPQFPILVPQTRWPRLSHLEQGQESSRPGLGV